MESSSIIFLFVAMFIVAVTILGILMLVRKGKGHLNVEKYRSKWLAIEQSLARDKPDSSLLAVLNADKLVDQALKDAGVGGESMGERMKTAQPVWTNDKAVWNAHKLRNKIAHEAGVKVTYDQARAALAGYKRALKDLGAI